MQCIRGMVQAWHTVVLNPGWLPQLPRPLTHHLVVVSQLAGLGGDLVRPSFGGDAEEPAVQFRCDRACKGGIELRDGAAAGRHAQPLRAKDGGLEELRVGQRARTAAGTGKWAGDACEPKFLYRLLNLCAAATSKCCACGHSSHPAAPTYTADAMAGTPVRLSKTRALSVSMRQAVPSVTAKNFSLRIFSGHR